MVEKLLKPPPHQYRLMCEPQELDSKTDLVVIRQPDRHVVGQRDFQAFTQNLCNLGFAPLSICPVYRDEDDGDRIFPTDSYREIADHLVINAMWDWNNVLSYLSDSHPSLLARLNHLPKYEQSVLTGGDYLYSKDHHTFIYAINQMRQPIKYDPPSTFLDDLKAWGFETIIPIETSGIFLNRNRRLNNMPDLDFLLSIYAGCDGNLHAIVAQAFMERAKAHGQQQLYIHPIPNREALRGGCNLADLRNGKVLVLPKPDKTPTTHKIIETFPPIADVLVSPFTKYDGGGQRCSMSSVSLG